MASLLLFMSIVILFVKYLELKALKKSKWDRIGQFQNQVKAMDETSKKGLGCFVLLVDLFFILFYLLGAKYVGTFYFTIYSFINIILAIRDIFVGTNAIYKPETFKANGTILNVLIDIIYVAFLIFNIYIKW